jgi:hypothetical protein
MSKEKGDHVGSLCSLEHLEGKREAYFSERLNVRSGAC